MQIVNSFRCVEKATVYGYMNATITAIINGHTNFVDENLLDPVDDRSLQAILHIGKVCKGDMVMFNLDTRGRRALEKVEGFLQSDGVLFAHLIQFEPCRPPCCKLWDASQHHETIVISQTIIGPVTYKFASASTIRIVVPAIVW